MNNINRGKIINFKAAIMAAILMISLICCELAYAAPITEEPQNPPQTEEPPQTEVPLQPQTPNTSPGSDNTGSIQNTGGSSDTRAADTRLSKLEISCGELVPEF